ncbi:hypothetical protein MMC30_002167 [Trapelia coarctata]|nr:hypothetical protein [Trapelia coarctata]
MGLPDLIRILGDGIEDPEEESFLLFSQSLPSQDLGFANSKAKTLELEVGGLNVTIHQSPTLLSSNRDGGTTGAVLWRISPIFADWITSPQNPLFHQGVLGPTSTVIELGCGISGVVALALAGRIGKYIATDQEYLLKTLKQNIDENLAVPEPAKSKKGTAKLHGRAERLPKSQAKVKVMALDWELSSLSSLPSFVGGSGTVDAVIACDCIYNEALIEPLVRTCADICRLRSEHDPKTPTVCVVAQQLRSPDVFEAWAKAFIGLFRFWRLPDELLSDELRSDSGYVVHLGILQKTTSMECS